MVLKDADLQILSRAYDRAWERFLRAGLLTPQNLSQSRDILAKNILAAAGGGTCDEWTLARNAFTALLRSELPGLPPGGLRGPRVARFKRRAR